MKVFLSPLAEFKLTKLLAYLEEEWRKQSKEKFLQKLEEKFKEIPVIHRATHRQRILMIYFGVSLLLKARFSTGF